METLLIISSRLESLQPMFSRSYHDKGSYFRRLKAEVPPVGATCRCAVRSSRSTCPQDASSGCAASMGQAAGWPAATLSVLQNWSHGRPAQCLNRFSNHLTRSLCRQQFVAERRSNAKKNCVRQWDFFQVAFTTHSFVPLLHCWLVSVFFPELFWHHWQAEWKSWHWLITGRQATLLDVSSYIIILWFATTFHIKIRSL